MVSQELGIPQISTGDMFRAAMQNGTALGLKAKEYISKGQLVPDELTIGIVRERLSMEDCQKGYILDGFPRTVRQAEALDTIADIDVVIGLDIADDLIVKRLSGRRVCPGCGAPYHVSYLQGVNTCKVCGTQLIQRDDDRPETVLNRLSVYHQQTAPLVDYYAQQKKLTSIPAEGDLEEIRKNIISVIEASV